MCFMDDGSGRSLPAIHRALDGGIDVDRYVAMARHERRRAGPAGFRAVAGWLRNLGGNLGRSFTRSLPGLPAEGRQGARFR
jgi:hypothetical protein